MVAQEDILTQVKFFQELANGIPYSELIIFEQGGHNFVVEFSDTTTKLMLKFLAKHRMLQTQ